MEIADKLYQLLRGLPAALAALAELPPEVAARLWDVLRLPR